jgi:Flp pilus assembly protein TadG
MAQPGVEDLSELFRSCRSFLAAEHGNASVEFTVLLPVFMGLVVFAADTATIFTRQSNMLSVSQQTARIVSRHALDAEAAEAFASDLLRQGGYNPDVTVDIDADTQIVTVVISAASDEIAPFGIISRALDNELTVSVSQALEPK